MRSDCLDQGTLGPGVSAEIFQAAVLCQDEPQTVVQDLITKQLIGRVIGQGDLHQDANELMHGRIVVDRSAERSSNCRRASHL